MRDQRREYWVPRSSRGMTMENCWRGTLRPLRTTAPSVAGQATRPALRQPANGRRCGGTCENQTMREQTAARTRLRKTKTPARDRDWTISRTRLRNPTKARASQSSPSAHPHAEHDDQCEAPGNCRHRLAQQRPGANQRDEDLEQLRLPGSCHTCQRHAVVPEEEAEELREYGDIGKRDPGPGRLPGHLAGPQRARGLQRRLHPRRRAARVRLRLARAARRRRRTARRRTSRTCCRRTSRRRWSACERPACGSNRRASV